MHVADLIFRAIQDRSSEILKSELGYNKDGLARDRMIVRLAALLHDVGHCPFSHAAEELFPTREDGSLRYKHEDYSAAIIRSRLKDVIENHPRNKNYGITAELVADLLEGKASAGGVLFWRELIIGQIDADRMDYLLRDSLHCGVDYGRYDLPRVVNTIQVILPRTQRGRVWESAKEGFTRPRDLFSLATSCLRRCTSTRPEWHSTTIFSVPWPKCSPVVVFPGLPGMISRHFLTGTTGVCWAVSAATKGATMEGVLQIETITARFTTRRRAHARLTCAVSIGFGTLLGHW